MLSAGVYKCIYAFSKVFVYVTDKGLYSINVRLRRRPFCHGFDLVEPANAFICSIHTPSAMVYPSSGTADSFIFSTSRHVSKFVSLSRL
jgi:hypothetical protein